MEKEPKLSHYYYLINGDLMKTVHPAPLKENVMDYDTVFNVWKSWLIKCSISNNEFDNIINYLYKSKMKGDFSLDDILTNKKGIDISDIVNDNNGIITFKHTPNKIELTQEQINLIFETGRNFQLTGENNLQELLDSFKK